MKDYLDAARKFIEAVYSKKSVSEKEFYGDSTLDRAYRDLTKAIEKAISEDVEWDYAVYEYCMEMSDSIRNAEWELDAVRERFVQNLQKLLAQVSSVDWLACVPLERAYLKFPTYTDFGSFVLLNPSLGLPKNDAELLSVFTASLREHCGVTFEQAKEHRINESYLWLGEHYLQKSGHYIPGRPTMVIKLGKGEDRANERLLKLKMEEIMPLLHLCQVLLETEKTSRFTIIPSEAHLPDGSRMNEGLISVPNVAVAINKANGDADWWFAGYHQYESCRGKGYDPLRFQEIWREFSVPIIEFRKLAGKNPCRTAIDNAIRLISQCRYPEFCNVTVNAVIATETIMNPFTESGEIKERFALLSSSLTEEMDDKRKSAYRRAKTLYNYRCKAVHRSVFFADDDSSHDENEALLLFFGCLKAVLSWATLLLNKNEKLNAEAFEHFYVNSVFKLGKND